LRTRILTRRGWFTHDQVRVGDETIGYNLLTGRCEWTCITAVHHPGIMETWRFGDDRWAVECTPEHRWLAEKEGSRRGSARTIEFVRLTSKRTRHRVILAQPAGDGSGLLVTLNEAALLAWVAGDGWERKAYARYGSTRGGATAGTYHVSQTKQENWPLIEQALSDGKSSVVRIRRGHKEWRLSSPYARDLVARAGNPKTEAVAQLLAMSALQRVAWLDAIIAAEGHRFPNGSIQVSQCEGPLAEAIMLAIYLSGSTASIYKDARYERVCLTIGITRNRLGRADHRGAFCEPAGRVEVWCVTTKLGTWTAEQDGHVFLTGNSVGGIVQGLLRGARRVIRPGLACSA
jgi:hypothetical protein